MSEVAQERGRARTIREILITGGDGLRLSALEQELMDDVEGYGKDLARELASVRMPFIPFMTDVVFEQVDYTSAGNQYYARRVGDIASTRVCYEALEKIVADTAGMSREDGMKNLKEALMALEGPNGVESGQDTILPFFMSLTDFWEAGGQLTEPGKESGIRSWLAKDNLFNPIARTLKINNSLAQKYGGNKAIAYDEFAMQGLLNEAHSMGITRKEEKDKNGLLMYTDSDDFLRRKKKVKLQWMIFAILRDLFKPLIAAAIYQGLKESGKQEKN
jgi:hypothetical protein